MDTSCVASPSKRCVALHHAPHLPDLSEEEQTVTPVCHEIDFGLSLDPCPSIETVFQRLIGNMDGIENKDAYVVALLMHRASFFTILYNPVTCGGILVEEHEAWNQMGND